MLARRNFQNVKSVMSVGMICWPGFAKLNRKLQNADDSGGPMQLRSGKQHEQLCPYLRPLEFTLIAVLQPASDTDLEPEPLPVSLLKNQRRRHRAGDFTRKGSDNQSPQV